MVVQESNYKTDYQLGWEAGVEDADRYDYAPDNLAIRYARNGMEWSDGYENGVRSIRGDEWDRDMEDAMYDAFF